MTISDQNSTSPTTNYASSIDYVKSGGADGLTLVARGGEPIFIYGSNFGPLGNDISTPSHLALKGSNTQRQAAASLLKAPQYHARRLLALGGT